MARRDGYDKTTVDITVADRDRLNALAAQLTADGPGRFGQRETIRWLLDFRESASAAIIEKLRAELLKEEAAG